MQSGLQRRQRAETLDDLIVEILRMTCCEPQTLDTSGVERIEDVDEARVTVEITTVRINVLTK